MADLSTVKARVNGGDLEYVDKASGNVVFSFINGNGSVPKFTTGRPRYSVADALTAHAGGGQGSALALTARVNRVTTVGTAADSVALPAAIAGEEIIVINAAAANAMNVFPASGDSINALSANTALSVVANKAIMFVCAVNGTWNSILTA